MITLPEKFMQTITDAHRQKGELWLKNFDELIGYCEQKWLFKVQSPFPLSYNFVAPVVFHNGSEAVLKLNVPREEINTEAAALRIYKGKGVVEIIDAEDDKGILILECLKPGNTLKSIKDDEEATLIAAGVMKKIQAPVNGRHLPFPTIAQWADGLKELRRHCNGETGPIPENLVRKAEALYPQLIATIEEPILLHGDLHHENILSAQREPWLAIDPAGLIGEAEYGVIPFLMNHLPKEQPIETIKRRVDIFANELGLNKERILAWAVCHATLSAWWCMEGNSEYVDNDIQAAMMFQELLHRMQSGGPVHKKQGDAAL